MLKAFELLKAVELPKAFEQLKVIEPMGTELLMSTPVKIVSTR